MSDETASGRGVISANAMRQSLAAVAPAPPSGVRRVGAWFLRYNAIRR
jgi:hypothetical protein